MTTNENNKKKSNKARKLVPAAGMLAISAAMLASSTYAWFTMSREVEVTNISMVATTPEDIQISLGRIGTKTNVAETSGKGVSLAANTGVLYVENGKADNGQVAPPQEMWDWADTADFAHYYQIGKLMPASSYNGENIFFTPDANGVGKTVKTDAKYYQANDNTTTVNHQSGASMTGMNSTGKDGTGYAKATLHAVTGDDDVWASTKGESGAVADYTNGDGGYQKSVAWNDTKDDGYYVDIPVWLRTSSTEETRLTVKGYVAPRNAYQTLNQDDEALYKAVRVAILAPTDTEQATGAAIPSGTTGLLKLTDGMGGITNSSAGQLSATPFSGTSILDWYTSEGNNGAVQTATNGSGATYNAAPIQYAYNDGFVTLTSGTGGEYGAATKVIVRVWLEGNDPDCWNDTAGQDWYINLKFGRANEMDDANITGARVNDGDNLTNTSGTLKY